MPHVRRSGRPADPVNLPIPPVLSVPPVLPISVYPAGRTLSRPARSGQYIECGLMPKPDELITGIAALVETGQSSRMSLTVVTGGAVLTGRLAPEAVWRQRVAEVLTGSAQLNEFAAVFDTDTKRDGPPTHLHFHMARILQGTMGIPETGGMYRVAIEDVSAWTVGDFSYSDH
ncbi:hypothetical protein QFZ63_004565 [Streptomyces sp. B3I7]|nr:hypothetical protein [Streptomyces sp. B3I7]